MTRFFLSRHAKLFAIAAANILTAIVNLPSASAAPTAEVAKRCLHYSYVSYPYKRPGEVQMSGERQAYFKDCLARNGDVPAPSPPAAAKP